MSTKNKIKQLVTKEISYCSLVELNDYLQDPDILITHYKTVISNLERIKENSSNDTEDEILTTETIGNTTIGFNTKKDSNDEVPTEDFDISKQEGLLPDWIVDKYESKFKQWSERMQRVLEEKAAGSPHILHKMLEEHPELKDWVDGKIETMPEIVLEETKE